jgi:hypothetical protein
MVNVLVIRPKDHGFKPGQGDGFLRAIKYSSTPSFRGEVKLEAPCYKILRHVKSHLQVWTKILCKAKFIIPSACCHMTVLVGLSVSSGGRIESFPLSTSFHHGSPCSYITLGMDSGCSSEM